MAADLLMRIGAALCVALMLIGASSAWTSTNVAKRIVGVLIAQIGALGALAVIGASSSLLLAGLGASFAMLVMGAAILVRLQEAYGGIEIPEIDKADTQDDRAEPGA